MNIANERGPQATRQELKGPEFKKRRGNMYQKIEAATALLAVGTAIAVVALTSGSRQESPVKNRTGIEHSDLPKMDLVQPPSVKSEESREKSKNMQEDKKNRSQSSAHTQPVAANTRSTAIQTSPKVRTDTEVSKDEKVETATDTSKLRPKIAQRKVKTPGAAVLTEPTPGPPEDRTLVLPEGLTEPTPGPPEDRTPGAAVLTEPTSAPPEDGKPIN